VEHTGSPIPEEIRARLAHPTIRLSGSISHAMVFSFFDQLLPVLEVEGSILVELFTDGGDAESNGSPRCRKSSGNSASNTEEKEPAHF
jgi:hypothetical protein